MDLVACMEIDQVCAHEDGQIKRLDFLKVFIVNLSVVIIKIVNQKFHCKISFNCK